MSSSNSLFPSSLSPVSSSSPLSPRVPFLCEKELGKLLRELPVKSATPTRTTPIPKDLDQRLEKLIDGLPMLRVRDTDDGESVAHLRTVIESQIQRLIENDPNNSTKYQTLLNKIKPSPEFGAHSSNQHQPQLDNYVRDLTLANSEDMFDDMFDVLNPDESRCLKVYCLLPEGFALSKTEIFHWCHGEPGEEDDIILHRLVECGFITRISSTSTIWFSNYFKMQGSVHSWLNLKVPQSPTYAEHGFHFSTILGQQIVVNISNKILNSYTAFNLIHEKIGFADLKLHLGNWRRQSAGHYKNYTTLNQDDYIVVNEDSLHEAFSRQMQIIYLSLRGTSGIVHFPDSVSNLRRLLYLDLSACNNLESLPKEIGSLTNLKYLDLSECYLLEHIPIEITSLSNLRVLKGFIIDSNPYVPQTSTRRKWYKKKVAAPASSSSTCPFSALGHLHALGKLTIRTKRMDFPTNQDLHTLCTLPELHTLEITWVGNPNVAQIHGNLQDFPNNVQKLVLQRAPHQTASQLLELIGKQKQDSNLKKLHIIGGWLQEFNPEKHCFHTVRILRLRYLPHLEGKWDQFIVSFPDLICLEVIQCPNLTSFPCDSSGICQMKQIMIG